MRLWSLHSRFDGQYARRVFSIFWLLVLLNQANSWAQVVGGFNCDSKPDLAVANTNSNSVSVLLNNGTGAIEWNLSDQASGVYLLQATTPTQHLSLKVIKP